MTHELVTIEYEVSGMRYAFTALYLSTLVAIQGRFCLFKMTRDHFVLVGPDFEEEPDELFEQLPEGEWGATFETIGDTLLTHLWRT